MKKKEYTKPELKVVPLDNSISLVMMTGIPGHPTMPRPPKNPNGVNSADSPFASPFDKETF